MRLTTTYEYKFDLIDSNDKVLIYRLIKMNDADKMRVFSSMHPEETRNFKTGDSLADFHLKDLNGNSYNFRELKGKILVLYFFLLEAPATKFEVPEINELYKLYQERSDVVFLAITAGSRSEARGFIKQIGFSFPLCPNAWVVMNRYDIYAWPTHVVVDRMGRVRLHNMTYNPQLSVFWIKKAIEAATTKEE
jgi:peroxiredoxin